MLATGVLGLTREQALAEPMSMIEEPAHARALLHADPSQVLNAAVLLGKTVKPKLTGHELAKAQLAAWDAVIPAMGRKGSRPKRRR